MLMWKMSYAGDVDVEWITNLRKPAQMRNEYCGVEDFCRRLTELWIYIQNGNKLLNTEYKSENA